VAVLTAADRIRLGNNGAKRVYAGALKVWERVSYLDVVKGFVSTPDLPADSVDGDLRLRAKLRADTMPSTGGASAIAMQRALGASNLMWDWRLLTVGSMDWRWSANGTSYLQGPTVLPNGTVTAGPDQWLGARHTTQGTGSHYYGERSTDGGATWQDVTDTTATSMVPFDSTAPVYVGAVPTGYGPLPGRIYWVQVEAINRARLVFPGVLWNVLTVPDAANLNVSGDLQVVARLQRPLATSLTTQRFISKDTGTASGNRGWAATWTNAGQLGLAMLPSASVLSTGQVGFAAGAMGWVRITRANATGAVVLEWAADQPSEPTSWTTLASTGSTTPGAVPVVTGTVRIGDRATTPAAPPLEPYAGRIARVIVRDGATTVLDISENNAATMVTPTTFVATSGQTVTVQDTSGGAVLFGSAGQASTPDLPLPTAFTVVARTRYNADTTGFPTHAAQNVPSDPRSYSVYRTTNNGRWYCEITTDGIWANRAGRFVAAPVPPIDVDVTAAVTIEPNRSGRMWMTPWTFNDATGQWTMGTPSDTGAAMIPFDSTAPHTIGASFVAGARLLFSEMRSGTDPRTGSVLWRFDANERTGTGTTYTDPRGLVWTLTNALAVAPKSPAPIVQPQADSLVWRFDANDYPGTGLTYVDPRGRTWSLSAAGVIAGP